jgi:hypothetical protein
VPWESRLVTRQVAKSRHEVTQRQVYKYFSLARSFTGISDSLISLGECGFTVSESRIMP